MMNDVFSTLTATAPTNPRFIYVTDADGDPRILTTKDLVDIFVRTNDDDQIEGCIVEYASSRSVPCQTTVEEIAAQLFLLHEKEESQ